MSKKEYIICAVILFLIVPICYAIYKSINHTKELNTVRARNADPISYYGGDDPQLSLTCQRAVEMAYGLGSCPLPVRAYMIGGNSALVHCNADQYVVGVVNGKVKVYSY